MQFENRYRFFLGVASWVLGEAAWFRPESFIKRERG